MAENSRAKDETRFWQKFDEDGNCTRCGLQWSDEEISGALSHECPPGFWTPLRTAPAPSAPVETRVSDWDKTWAAYQDFLKVYPQHRDEWATFYAGAEFGRASAPRQEGMPRYQTVCSICEKEHFVSKSYDHDFTVLERSHPPSVSPEGAMEAARRNEAFERATINVCAYIARNCGLYRKSFNAQEVKDIMVAALGSVEGTRGTEWISVKERLPEDGESAVIFVPEWQDDYLRYRVAFINYDETTPIWVANGEAVENVTYWAALPAAPTEGK